MKSKQCTPNKSQRRPETKKPSPPSNKGNAKGMSKKQMYRHQGR